MYGIEIQPVLPPWQVVSDAGQVAISLVIIIPSDGQDEKWWDKDSALPCLTYKITPIPCSFKHKATTDE